MPSSPTAAISVLAMEDAATAAKPAIAATKAAIVDALPPDPIAAGLEELCRQQQKLRKERKDLARQVKNAKKKVQRLKGRARALTDDDLVAVLMMRKAAATAKAEPGAGGVTGSSSSSASSSSGSCVAPTANPPNRALAGPSAAAEVIGEDAMDREE